MKPQPQTYAERLRGTMSWALLIAGIVCAAMAIGALMIAWRGGWPTGTEHQRLSIVGWALLGALSGMGAVIVSLAIGGPVGRFKAGVGRGGATVEAEDHDVPPAATVTTTTVIAPSTSPPPSAPEPRP